MEINLGSSSSETSESSESSGDSTSSKVGISCFFSFFLLMGLGFTAAVVWSVWQRAEVRGWTAVPCTIVESRGDTSSYQYVVRYRYQVDGRERVGTKLNTSSDKRDDWIDVQRLIDAYRPGDQVTCLVDPADPSRAVLETESLWMALIIFLPLIFVVIGGGGIWFTWFAKEAEEKAKAASSEETTSSKIPLLLGVPFFGIFLVVGLVAFKYAFLDPFVASRAAPGWPQVPGEVVRSWVAEHESDEGGTTYSVKILFRYTYEGRERHADTYAPGTMSSSGRADKRAVVRQYPRGKQVTCYVNPDDPAEAYINPKGSGAMYLGLFTLLFVLVGGGGIWWLVRDAMSSAPGPLGGAGELVHAADWLPDYRKLDGPTELAPLGARFWKLVGMLLVALFWNGIVGVFLSVAISGWQRGSGEIFLTIFLIPFVLIGLVFIAGVVYFAMGLLNPAPRLLVADAAPHLGETFVVSWSVAGNASRIQRLRIDLKGTEHATYVQGTTTTTDTEVFARYSLLDTTDPLEMAGGEGGVNLPREGMHSLKLPNNKITWSIHVRGTVGMWPDIDDDYEIAVLPALPETR